MNRARALARAEQNTLFFAQVARKYNVSLGAPMPRELCALRSSGERARQQSCVFTSQSIVRLYNDECAPRDDEAGAGGGGARARPPPPLACDEFVQNNSVTTPAGARFRLYSEDARRCFQAQVHHAPVVGNPELSEFAAFFRAPDQRLLSAWFYGKHLWGAMPSWETKIARASASTPRLFAEFPGVASCYTKMLQNCGCSSHVMTAAEVAAENAERERPGVSSLRPGIHRCGGGPRGKHLWLGPRAARLAARRVLAFRFVGITELWRASVCLWHRRVGAGGGPRADELAMCVRRARPPPPPPPPPPPRAWS